MNGACPGRSGWAWRNDAPLCTNASRMHRRTHHTKNQLTATGRGAPPCLTPSARRNYSRPCLCRAGRPSSRVACGTRRRRGTACAMSSSSGPTSVTAGRDGGPTRPVAPRVSAQRRTEGVGRTHARTLAPLSPCPGPCRRAARTWDTGLWCRHRGRVRRAWRRQRCAPGPRRRPGRTRLCGRPPGPAPWR